MLDSPKDLPDFHAPPLNEVVLGVQFNPPIAYHQIRAGEVWNLFKADYPQVQEMPPLPPTFETFGRESGTGSIQLVPGPLHSRFWFLRTDGDELIQFQQDRLLHNWRKVPGRDEPYPRFESIAPRFRKEIEALQGYLTRLAPQALVINQIEISYINQFTLGTSKVSEWLRFLDFGLSGTEDFSVVFRETIQDNSGKPQGRLVCEVLSAVSPEGERGVQMNLTARGAPRHSNIESAVEFITIGRSLIVNKFAMLTTDYAHKQWGRHK